MNVTNQALMTRNPDSTAWNPDIKDFLRLSYMQ